MVKPPIRFSIVCYVQHTSTQLWRTVSSLCAQSYHSYSLVAVGDIGIAARALLWYARICGCANTAITMRGAQAAKCYKQAAKAAQGEYLIFVHSGDILHADALSLLAQATESAEAVYTDEVIIDKDGGQRRMHKPDYSPDTLAGHDYIGGAFTCSAKAYGEVGGIDESYGTAALTQLRLSLAAIMPLAHIGKACFYTHAADSAPPDTQQLKRAASEYLHSLGRTAQLETIAGTQDCFRIKYAIAPCKTSIIIQSHDHAQELKICIDSILKYTENDIEIIIVENGSTQPELMQLYEQYRQNTAIKLLAWDKPWSYAAINNYAAGQASGEQLLLLNNDTQVLDNTWLDELLMYSQRAEVGAVGAKLLYPSGKIQHAGVITGICGAARHAFAGCEDGEGYMHRLQLAQNITAVTAACLMIKKQLYLAIGGMDENLAVGNNDVDMCLSLRKKGYLNIFTPQCRLIHNESVSRTNDGAQHERAVREDAYLAQKWHKELSVHDPYYSAAFMDNNAGFIEKPVSES